MEKDEVFLVSGFSIVTVITIVFTSLSLFVLVTLRFHVDKSIIITVLTYISCFIAKFTYWLMHLLEGEYKEMVYRLIIDLTSTYLQIGICYYFTYEMRVVELKLECEQYLTFL